MAYEVTVIKEFAAAHKLVAYPGNCSQVHGHTWKVELVVVGDKLDDIGMLIDFRQVKRILDNIITEYDHTYLNDIPPFDTINPTAENIAKIIYDRASIMLGNYKVKLVKVWESPNAYITYGEE